MGIPVSTNNTGLTSPQFAGGGIVLHNPHSLTVNIKIMIAGGGTVGTTGLGTTGTSGSSGGGFGSSGSSGTSGTSSLPADYHGTSGNTITIL
jgi:hypothetical protein